MNESPSATDTLSAGWVRHAARLNLVLGITFAAIFIFFAFRARFTVPYFDDWPWLASVLDGPFNKGLWQPRNEHIIVIPRLLLWVDYWIWGWPGYATLFAALLSHAAIAGVLILASRDRSRDEVLLLSGSILVLTFLTYELQGAVFAGSVLFPLVAAFSTIAIACLANCAGNSSERSISRSVNLSALVSVMAMLCLTNGLVVPFILAGLSLLLRLRRRTTVMFLTLGVVGLIARYALGSVPGTVLSASHAAILRFGLAMLAGPIASLSPQLAVGVGGCFSALAVWALWRFIRARVRTAADTLLVGSIWFVMATAAMASLGRAQFDLSVAAESRYTELAAIGWASLLLIVMPAGVTNRPIGKLAAVLLPVVALAALPAQVFVGRVWAAKADHLDVASLALAVGVNDEDWIWRVHPFGAEEIDPVLQQLRARDVGFLAFPERGRQTLNPTTPAVQCEGSVEAVDLQAGSGLRVHGHIRERGGRVRIVDSESRVRGLAKPAPLVPHARATPNDFVWAELEVLAGRLNTDENWLGFATWGSGPPFRAELIDAAGQLVCQASITCCSEPRLPPSRRELVVRGSLPEGWLDAADCTMIAGWAWDSARPNESVDVRITISDGQDMTVAASSFRQDLLEHGKGNGHHGFVVGRPQLRIGSGTRRVSASIAATGVPLTGSPKTVVCPE